MHSLLGGHPKAGGPGRSQVEFRKIGATPESGSGRRKRRAEESRQQPPAGREPRPRKRLGQHFLRDQSILQSILEAASVEEGEAVLEVGAGTGLLTEALLGRGARVLAVELDDRLANLLTERFAHRPNLDVWHGDVLDFDPGKRFSAAYKLLGNIPYYITGPILRHFLEASSAPSLSVLMVQREVAERIVASPGALSVLAVSVQFYAYPEIIRRVPAAAFYPRPKVDSALIRLTSREPPCNLPASLFFTVVRAGFGTRRKQLGNALSHGLGLQSSESRALLETAEIDLKRRAETLSLEEWCRLASRWESFTASEVLPA